MSDEQKEIGALDRILSSGSIEQNRFTGCTVDKEDYDTIRAIITERDEFKRIAIEGCEKNIGLMAAKLDGYNKALADIKLLRETLQAFYSHGFDIDMCGEALQQTDKQEV